MRQSTGVFGMGGALELVGVPKDTGRERDRMKEFITNKRLMLSDLAETLLYQSMIPSSRLRCFELFITKSDVSHAGRLADFMADIAESGFEEKLRILASLDVKIRLDGFE
ncbi:hypothetical protein AtubIFM55763_004452 [Aspergillus tubingensis]|nr:hypothetical protein AtubIFM55763_004452 [Aspergillus tubingensis]